MRRRSHDKHREKRNAYSRAYVKARPDSSRLSTRKARGVLNATGETRHGACPVCDRIAQLVCDHNHSTGQVRGWVCARCNAGLGQIGDTLAAARRLVRYLESAAS